MIRKYHNHTLQTKSRYHEEDSQDTNSHKTPGRQNKVRATNSQNRIKIIAKLEGTQSSAQQNVIKTNQHEQDKLLRTGSSLSYLCVWGGGGIKCILLVPNFHPRLYCC